MREQITLNAISESRMCIVVLSAHQALSTMDLALLRIICSVEAREVLIFVNRIDELPDPVTDTKNIERDIRLTLSRLGLAQELPILFGSGYWANCALDDTCADMMEMSRSSLGKMYPKADLSKPETLRAMAMEGSGIGALHRAVAHRVVEGPGNALLRDIQIDLSQVSEMRDTVVNMSEDGASKLGEEEAAEIKTKIKALEERAVEGFEKQCEEQRDKLKERLERAQGQFVDTAVEALQSHIDAFGEMDNWSHEPSSLRMMMRSAYTNATTKLRRDSEWALEEIADGMQEILQYDLNVFYDSSQVDFPQPPRYQPPTALAKTLSLDLQPSWWRKFWRFGTKNRAESRYRGLIESEIAPVIQEVLDTHFKDAVDSSRKIIVDFFSDQSRFVNAILDCSEGSNPDEKPSKSKRSAA